MRVCGTIMLSQQRLTATLNRLSQAAHFPPEPPMPSSRPLPSPAKALTFAAMVTAALLLAGSPPVARAQSTVSEASALSALPLVISVTAPVAILAAGATLTVASVEAVSNGTVWVLERASDGARATLRFSTRAVAGASTAVGTAVVVTTMASGYVLSAAGKAIAFIPNEVGNALIYNERVSQ